MVKSHFLQVYITRAVGQSILVFKEMFMVRTWSQKCLYQQKVNLPLMFMSNPEIHALVQLSPINADSIVLENYVAHISHWVAQCKHEI